MQKGIQKGLFLLITIVFAVTISGIVSATDANGYTAHNNYVQCQYNHQISDNNNYCNKVPRKLCQTPCDNKKTCERNYNDLKCKDKCIEQKCVPPKVKCPNCTSTIGDRVWNDSNANGIQDVDEKGIENVTVNLWRGNTSGPVEKINSTKTDSNGNYYFTNLVKGIYWLEFILPEGTAGTWKFSPQNQGTDDALDSDPNASGIAGPIDLTKCICDPSWDAGMVFTPEEAAGGENGGAAGGEEEIPTAAGGEEFAAAGGEELIVAAAGEEEVSMQETGVPIGLLAMAVLMALAGLIIPKRK